MKQVLIAIGIILFVFSGSPVSAHSGRTDSSGGHNCRVGACAGTYHYHNGGYAPPAEEYYPTYTPVPTRIPTKIPTRIPTKIPTEVPTDTPTPTLTPKPTLESAPVKLVEQPEEKKGFWNWLFSFFN
jgi:hypothetical protein